MELDSKKGNERYFTQIIEGRTCRMEVGGMQTKRSREVEP